MASNIDPRVLSVTVVCTFWTLLSFAVVVTALSVCAITLHLTSSTTFPSFLASLICVSSLSIRTLAEKCLRNNSQALFSSTSSFIMCSPVECTLKASDDDKGDGPALTRHATGFHRFCLPHGQSQALSDSPLLLSSQGDLSVRQLRAKPPGNGERTARFIERWLLLQSWLCKST